MSYVPHSIKVEQHTDDSLIVTSHVPLGPVVASTGDWVTHWANQRPNHVFLAERSGPGWHSVTYADLAQQVHAVAASLLGLGLVKGDRILCLSGPSVDHGILTLAAQYVGLVTVPIAEQYSLIPQARDKLRYAVHKIAPKAVFAQDHVAFSDALEDACLTGALKIVSSSGGCHLSMDRLRQGDATVDVDLAHRTVRPDDLAKILFTSGSTSHPKGVPQTHRMMCVNQAQYLACWPFLADRPQVILDWLPWNHVFAGSSDFNMMLSTGGSLYLDDGKPVTGLFDRTLENIALMPGTLSLNVPVAYGMLVKACQKDANIKRKFFGDLDLIFYAGASLPRDLWQALESLSRDVTGKVPMMTSSWGMTETAPMAVIHHQGGASSGMIGVPAPDVSMKLLPKGDNRYELRVKGPNVITAYFEEPEKDKSAFDPDGYLITEDAVRFVDPADPSLGVMFDGRLSEDFKLLTGTWVQAGMLRLRLLQDLGPLAQDVVITGADRMDLGVLVIPPANHRWAGAQDGVVTDAEYVAALRTALTQIATSTSGSSQRIVRAAVLSDPPSVKDGEITAKGNLNNALVLKHRADIVELMYSEMPHKGIIRVE